ncbi:hypothetical protein [Pseudomonas sp. LFM046]|uniref:hypothetical protein n=1 Tax=Pseudomonas sp. LFM046 TaxID=1608357 RepID=UPI0005CFE9D4|nr:hypothetical protein [Pseudomonas sp. LFM046]
MQCNVCQYEFTLNEIQSGAECPKCAEAQRLERRAAEIVAEKAQPKAYVKPQEVVVVDFQMSFNSMVWLMVKAALASIPAFIILFLIGAALTFFFGAFFGALTKI